MASGSQTHGERPVGEQIQGPDDGGIWPTDNHRLHGRDRKYLVSGIRYLLVQFSVALGQVRREKIAPT